jgi:hypothetical protein
MRKRIADFAASAVVLKVKRWQALFQPAIAFSF